ncbi:choice-of-anchor X domain-containing protein [Oceanimonas sp. CHS3-5]|uniref:choice-of-anchor X domain-containing protein n=1 Tax=Oceanimonas sp. CHS3-5 TaxID=3068186 RepID=UPI00273E701C|nr:choice-of-anchor X domain-containing protein [Oceanimonas sp. CHS3-5]MDP5290761.1 choice-of-anchor X domain-containing protein [Oceanimonas sp. CHS3-5]
MMLRILPMLALLPVMFAHAEEQHARWLGNTFRIDPSIREVTLFIEREGPSIPVVLIRPDGSKYYYQRHPDTISWASTPTRDVITLWQPEPGPWQATGKIAGEHGITLLSVFRLELDELPAKLYQNEVIRLHGQLLHGNTTLDANYYLDGLGLTAQLYSRAEAQQADPFNRAPLPLGEFVDDGTGLDPVPGDGNMTAEVVFEALPGSYLFQAEVSNGVLARYAERNITLYPMPVRARFTTPDSQRRWRIELDADSNIDTDSLTVTGELINPLEQTLAISGQGRHIELPPARQPGNYRWQGRAYATTVDDREIQLQLNEQVVRVVPPLPEVTQAPDQVTAKEGRGWPLWAGLAGLALVSAGGGLWWWRRRRR